MTTSDDVTHEAHMAKTSAVRPIAELSDSGLLWLINRVVFHPRGMALALHVDRDDNNAVLGWSILPGDGSAPYAFDGPGDDKGYALAEATLAAVIASRIT